MIVVADSGPLINLARVHRFGLLRDLYQEVLLPEQVHREVVVVGRGLAGSEEVASSPWCRIMAPPIDLNAARVQHPQLGAGELAAILGAVRDSADLLLCDDLAARGVAERRGLTVKGTLGIFIEAKAHGLVTRVGDVIEELLKTGAWLNPAVAREALRLAGELR